ncbi:hypothetical protein HAX54_022687 [Datura stramonium]|uniref:Uncharacterized protein n=1 Tax=Datura stramonium TaxID=4076 RepID=A0ABS8S484_DATST|nr:hypothetical protein [Datura stramonium]
MSLPSSSAPSSAPLYETTATPPVFENPFSKSSDSPKIPPVEETSMTSPPYDSYITPIDINTSLNPQTNDPPVDTSAKNSAQIGVFDPDLLSTSGLSQPLDSATEVVPKKSPLETSYDYLFKGDLPIEKGTLSNILAHGDQLIIQSLIQMALGGECSPNSERTLSRSPSSVPKSPILSSTPKWDGTPGVLNLQQNAENEADASDDNHPLI